VATLVRRISLVVALAAAFTLPLQAFNPGAHIYIATRALQTDDPYVWYGSVAPDLAWYSSEPESLGNLHTNLDLRLYPITDPVLEAFARGWAAHGEITGADRMAHWEWDHAREGYIIERARLLTRIPAGRMREELGHKAIEAAIDLLLKRQDPTIGQRVAAAAVAAQNHAVSQFLAGTFVANGVDPMAGLTGKGTLDYVLLHYAGALNLPAPYDLEALATLGVQEAAMAGYEGLTVDDIKAILEQAMSVCPDYMRVINEAIRQVKEHQ